MITEFMWLPWGKPIPEGWEEIPQHQSHHHHWSRLISRPVTDEAAQEPLPAAAE